MSRNIGQGTCYFCSGEVADEEPPRSITVDEAGPYFNEYRGMLVARASCVDCGARYLAWLSRQSGLDRDLSFRSTFDDEPGADDLPQDAAAMVRRAARLTLRALRGAWRDWAHLREVDAKLRLHLAETRGAP